MPLEKIIFRLSEFPGLHSVSLADRSMEAVSGGGMRSVIMVLAASLGLNEVAQTVSFSGLLE